MVKRVARFVMVLTLLGACSERLLDQLDDSNRQPDGTPLDSSLDSPVGPCEPSGNGKLCSLGGGICVEGCCSEGSLLQNPGFEADTPALTSKLTGWTVTGEVDLDGFGTYSAPDNSQAIDLVGLSHATIEQTIAVSPGVTYGLAVEFAANCSNGVALCTTPAKAALVFSRLGVSRKITLESSKGRKQTVEKAPWDWGVIKMTWSAAGDARITLASLQASSSNGGLLVNRVLLGTCN